MKSAIQNFQLERAQQLAKKEFPHQVSKKFFYWLKKALMHTNIGSTKMVMNTYIKAIGHKDETTYVMPEIHLFIQILEGTTPAELGQTLQQNLIMLLEIVEVVKIQWNEIDKEISNKIQDEITADLVKNNVVPIGTDVFAGLR